MTQFLRSLRIGRWDPPDWEAEDRGEIQADALRDIETTRNLLSVYRVDSTLDVDRVVNAMAANRANVQPFDYALIDDAHLAALGIRTRNKPGSTPDIYVNQRHYDLGELNARQIMTLAKIISDSGPRRISRPKIQGRIIEAIESGDIDVDAIPESLKSRRFPQDEDSSP